MTVRVSGLAFGRIAKQARDFRLAFDVGDLGEIEIAAIGLALACERILEILMGFGSFEICHFLFLLILTPIGLIELA
jgi:hypothetical protein